MVTAVLAQEYRVFSKAGNWNSMHSLTCSLQSIENGIDLLVQEVDEKRPDNPYCCSRILSPEIAVVTNVAESHIGYLGGLKALAKSFSGITAGMDENGVLILNGDDENSLHAGFDARTLLVAIRNEKADCRAMNIDSGPEGTEFDVCFRGETVHVRLSAYGEHNVYDAMMAYVVGKLKGVSTEKILAGLKSYRNSGIRQNVCRVGGETVYADCYNASPTSIAFAVKAFCDLPGTTGRKVAVIGDIAEVDGYEEETYRRIAETVDTSDVDILVTYGGNSEMIWDYLTRPMAKRHARTAEELYDRLRSLRAEGENSYLFKASRVMKLEDAIRDVFPEHYREIKLSEKLY